MSWDLWFEDHGRPWDPQIKWCWLDLHKLGQAIFYGEWMNIEEWELFRYFTSSFLKFNKRDQSPMHLGDQSCILLHWLLNRDLFIMELITFIERVKTDHLHFEVSIKSHLTIDVFAECGFSCSWSTSDADDDSLDGFFN